MRNPSAPADDEADDVGDVTDVGRADRIGHVPQPRSAPGPQPRSAPGPQPRSVPGPQPRSAPDSEPDEPPEPAVPARPALSQREHEILAFERRWWKHAGAKEQAIRDAFDLSATRYYQILNGLLDNPAALAAEPMLVARLRRLRATRSRNRRR